MEYLGYLILVRHGESRWNIANKFTGWVDVALSEKGIQQSIKTAKNLEKYNIDIAFTSKLSRAQETLLLILSEQKKTGIFLHKNDWKSKWFLRYNNKEFEKDEIPIHSSEKLNERYYGSIQGIKKNDARNKWGAEKVFAWRRSFDIRPPSGESLKDVYKRATSYFKSTIMKHVKSNQNVIISAHGNSLRAIIKFLLNLNDQDIPSLDMSFDNPTIFKYENGQIELVSKKLSFDRPIEWELKRIKGKTTITKLIKKSPSKRKSSSKKVAKKKVAKKKTAKRAIKHKPVKKTSKKRTTTRKKVSKKKKSSPKKKTAKKSVKRKATKKAKRKVTTKRRS